MEQTNNITPGGMPPVQQMPALPNATAVLVLGILSIVPGCFCYGLVGIILGIIALSLSSKAGELYKQNPSAYSLSSYNNMKAGKVCAIIGLALSALYLIIIIFYIAMYGWVLTRMPWHMMN
jgi:hypothetical protein